MKPITFESITIHTRRKLQSETPTTITLTHIYLPLYVPPYLLLIFKPSPFSFFFSVISSIFLICLQCRKNFKKCLIWRSSWNKRIKHHYYLTFVSVWFIYLSTYFYRFFRFTTIYHFNTHTHSHTHTHTHTHTHIYIYIYIYIYGHSLAGTWWVFVSRLWSHRCINESHQALTNLFMLS